MTPKYLKITFDTSDYEAIKKAAGYEPLASWARRMLLKETAEGIKRAQQEVNRRIDEETRRDYGAGSVDRARSVSAGTAAPPKSKQKKSSWADDETAEEFIDRMHKEGKCPHEVKIGNPCFMCKGGIAR